VKKLALLIAAATAAPVFAADPAEPAKKERLVCRSEGASESRLSRSRTCLTAEQWKARAKAGRADEHVLGVINKGGPDGFGTVFVSERPR
jgi:hypothetical protein